MENSETEKNANLSQLKRLYPFINDVNSVLPTCWNQEDKNSSIWLDDGCLAVHYKGQGKAPKDAASVRADQPIPTACGIYYFEVKILSKGRDGYMGVGLSTAEVNTNRLPGWDKHSYGYHGDDGNSFCSCGTGQPYGPTFTTGDVIGCCVNMIDNTCFFTKNGINLGVAFKDIPPRLYPTVGLQTPGEIVEANFGQQSFLFDVEDYMKEYKLIVRDQIMQVNIDRELLQSALHRIISSYLVHYGYCSTAEAFAQDTGQFLEEEILSIKNRQYIQKLVLSGRIGEAIATTQKLYPGLLDNKPDLLFMLKCRQFVEMINGTDTEVNVMRSPASPVSKIQTKSSTHTYHSLHNNSSDHANNMNTNELCIPSETPFATNGYHNDKQLDEEPSNNLLNDDGNGTPLDGAESNGQVEHMDVDSSQKTSTQVKSDGHDFNKNLIKILQFGRELKAMNKKLSESSGCNKVNDNLLQSVFSLLAYADPWNSPVGSQLDPIQREPVCTALNSAILESRNLPQIPVLETILAQTNGVVDHMSQAGIGASAFAHLSTFLPNCKLSKLPTAFG